tara:strand:+ start:28 stop:288 length:261 start_codon:yes stop_codon:yes gene_type:complete
MPKNKFRPIVKDAMKVSELMIQFNHIDMHSNEQINNYSDSYLINEANHHLGLALQEYNNYDDETKKFCRRDIKQLRKFLNTWQNKK